MARLIRFFASHSVNSRDRSTPNVTPGGPAGAVSGPVSVSVITLSRVDRSVSVYLWLCLCCWLWLMAGSRNDPPEAPAFPAAISGDAVA